MSIATGTFSVRCNNKNCGKQHDFSPEDADFDDIGGDSERQMGPENLYGWDYDFDCECGQHIEISVDASEYPQGIYNNSTYDVKGATVVSEFDFDFSSHFDEN